jgi:hypothetical protein
VGPLSGLTRRASQPAAEEGSRHRAELPPSRDAGSGSRSWMSSMKQAASKTGHAIGHGFNRAGHALHKFGQALNEPQREPAWMSHMSEDERAHYDYYGELPAESSHSSHSSYVAPPWERPASSPQHHQPQATQLRQRPMNDAEQAAENAAAAYHGVEPRTTVEELVSRPPSSPAGRTSAGSVRTRPMNHAEQAAENEAARYHGVEPRTTVEEFVAPRRSGSSSPAPAARPSAPPTRREALLNNIRQTVPQMNLHRLDHAEPREFVRFAQHLTRGTPYEAAMNERARTNASLGREMHRNWLELRNVLEEARAQGHKNVPTVQWLFENRPTRVMLFLLDGVDNGRLARPTTVR